MSDKVVSTPKVEAPVLQRAVSTVTKLCRLEGESRSEDLKHALRAEVHDALWMLTKQWQMGEFIGDDAGSPILAKIQVATTKLNKYQAADHACSFPKETPLEAVVEKRPIAFKQGNQKMALDIRLQMGRQWLKMIEKIGAGGLRQYFIEKYPIKLPDELPNPEKNIDGAIVFAHPEVWAQFAAVSGRAMDGWELYSHLLKNPPLDRNDSKLKDIVIPESAFKQIDETAKNFKKWFESLYVQPSSGDDAWKPSSLEYQFRCSAPAEKGEKVYTADEYAHGHLDWYSMDLESKASIPEASSKVQSRYPEVLEPTSFIPTAISFPGMPNTRWWTFEDGRTNFGDIKPGTTELAKLLLIDFGLVYANDWFIFPLEVDTGTITSIRGLTVTNDFGERFWICPASKGEDEDWQRWSMFTTSIKGHSNEPADMSLLMLPTVPLVQEGAPLEEVMLIRDEAANMVWGIEQTIPLPDGSSKRGSEAAGELFAFLQSLIKEKITGPKSITYKAPIRYSIMSSVPENWIPFIPVHLNDSKREIQLQRAAMPRVLKGASKYLRVKPRTNLMRQGLDFATRKSYYLHEEEVPRAGAYVKQSFQRTRWINGEVFVWLGVRKQTGRGEGSSRLAFDQIIPVE